MSLNVPVLETTNWKPIQVVFPSTCFSTLVERLLCYNIYCVRLVTAANVMLSIDPLTVYFVSKHNTGKTIVASDEVIWCRKKAV